MEEVILHIGTHKTGSTSIQRSLAGYDDGDTIYSRLSRNGSHLRPLATIFSENYYKLPYRKKTGLSRDKTDSLRRKLHDILDEECARSDRRRLILSSEALWNAPVKQKERIVSYFEELGLKIIVICYVRDTLDFAASWTQQRVRAGEKSIRMVVTDLQGNLGWFCDRVGMSNVVVRHFSKNSLFQGSVVKDFCNFLELKSVKEIRSNESLSGAAIKLIYRFNKFGPISRGSNELLSARIRLIEELSGAYPGGKIDRSHFRPITPDIQDDYVYLQKAFGIEFSSDFQLDDEIGDLETLLLDLSDVDLGPLDNLIIAHGFDPEFFVTPVDKLTALYYAQLMKKRPSLKSIQKRTLRDAFGALGFLKR